MTGRWIRRWTSTVSVDGAIGYLTLAHPDGRSYIHLFDSDLAGQVAALPWHPAANGEYAGTRGVPPGSGTYYLHWLALGMPGGHGGKIHVDHINRDPADSRRENLRVVSNRINHHNQRRQSPYGICIHRCGRGYFEVMVRFAHERVFHPAFKSLSDAERCRDAYQAIAQAVDAGLRPPPDRTELKAISDRLRMPPSLQKPD